MSALSVRNHVLYILTNTITGEKYVGITVAEKRAFKKSANKRFRQHCSRALAGSKEWNLCRSIREHTPAAFIVEVHAIIRGRAAAHRMERTLIRTLAPALNTV